jgi:CheY-like chemotaxis protein
MRALVKDHHLRGIALSGFGMEDDVKRAEEAGFSRHLTKPVDFETLLTNIRELLAVE